MKHIHKLPHLERRHLSKVGSRWQIALFYNMMKHRDSKITEPILKYVVMPVCNVGSKFLIVYPPPDDIIGRKLTIKNDLIARSHQLIFGAFYQTGQIFD